MYESQTLNDLIFDHCNKSMNNAIPAERHPLWKRLCPELNDTDFIRLGILRCISSVDSGRHFLQTAEDIHQEQHPLSTYKPQKWIAQTFYADYEWDLATPRNPHTT